MPSPRTSILRFAALAAATLTLAACGLPASPGQLFVEQHTACPTANYQDIQWAPGDGEDAWIIYTLRTDQRSEVHRIRADGSNDTLLAADAEMPMLSPDGSMLLVNVYTPTVPGGLDTRVLDLATLRVVRSSPTLIWPRWLPDSRSLSYYTTSPRRYFRLSVESGEAAPLPDIPAEALPVPIPPVWAPDGKHFAFASSQGGGAAVSIVNAADGRITRAARGDMSQCSSLNDYPIAWSPDSRSLAVLRLCSQGSGLHVAGPDGALLADWGHLPGQVQTLAWSPDGTQIATVILSVLQYSVFIANVDGSGSRLLRANASAVAWSPSGDWLAIVATDTAGYADIYTIRPDGAAMTRITDNPGREKVCPH